jgi:hypothetical protein
MASRHESIQCSWNLPESSNTLTKSRRQKTQHHYPFEIWHWTSQLLEDSLKLGWSVAIVLLRYCIFQALPFTDISQTGNEKYDLERAERQAKERARAHIKFEELSKSTVQKRKADEEEEKVAEDTSDSDSDSESSSESSVEAAAEPVVTPVPKKKRKLERPESVPTSGSSTPSVTSRESPKNMAEKQRQELRKAKRQKKKKSKRPKRKAVEC